MANKHDYGERSLQMHYGKHGKIEIIPTVPVKTSEDLSLAYTPGVATPCLAIQKDPELSFCLTRRWNTAQTPFSQVKVYQAHPLGSLYDMRFLSVSQF